MTDEKILEACKALGYEAADSLMSSAVEDSDTLEQMNNQLLATYWAGVHILASHMFNGVKQNGEKEPVVISLFMHDIETEYRALVEADKNGEIQEISPKNGAT